MNSLARAGVPLALLGALLTLAGCTKQASEHPWVKSGMTYQQVREIVGNPLRVDDVFHRLEYNPGHMNTDVLDSLRRAMPDSLARLMAMGHPLDLSARSEKCVTWYYGPEITDTLFTIDSVGTALPQPRKVWYACTKQRAILFELSTGQVKSAGFSVLKVVPL